MFVAKWNNRKSQVNVLDAQWADAGVMLREATHRGELCCPHCDQEVWLREGERRRRHFAHKHLADCPFQGDSEEVSEVKARLYTWLQQENPGRVEMNVQLDLPDKPGFLDLVVRSEHGNRFGYFIFMETHKGLGQAVAERKRLCLQGVRAHAAERGWLRNRIATVAALPRHVAHAAGTPAGNAFTDRKSDTP